MVEKLTRLYNTLATIETKGENTKTMALCLNYVQQLVSECAANQSGQTEKEDGDKV